MFENATIEGKASGRERRRYKRYQVKQGISALLRAGDCCLASVGDVSEGGMGLNIVRGSVHADEAQQAELTLFDENLGGMWDFQCRIVHSSPAPRPAGHSASLRCGIEFERITMGQLFNLSKFIRSHTVDWELPERISFDGNGTAIVRCRGCGREKVFSASPFNGLLRRARVKCCCGRAFRISFDTAKA
jgi:hypothetical protein